MSRVNYQQGVVVLFSMILVSVILSVSLVLLNITLRQLILSSLARESQFAYYAADTARACARHYDSIENSIRPFGYFGLDSGGTFGYQPPGASAIGLANLDCGGAVTSYTVPPPTTDPAQFDFTIHFTSGTKHTCATVTVLKYEAAAPPIGANKTQIIAKGYNNYDPANNTCYADTDRTVERAATMIY